MKTRQIAFSTISVLVFVCQTAIGRQGKDTTPADAVDIRQVMSAAEFARCGLAKLSPEEMTNLNKWLLSYSLKLVSTSVRTADTIESTIEGEFEGWSGETIFKLDNGQIWQQSSYAYTYHYAYRPKVLIYKTDGGFQMKVDGVDGTIYVTQLK